MRTVTRGFSRATLAIAFLASNPAAGLCQAGASTPPLVRVDVSASFGAFGAHHDVQGDEPGVRNWSSSLFKGAGIGYYWSDHLKTEIEASWPGPTEAYSSFSTRLADGTSAFGIDEHSFRTVVLSAAQLYQFGRNSFFHPFAGAGVEVIREHDTIERNISTSRGTVTTDIAEAHAVRARGFVTAGFKAYVSERAFFRSEF